MGRIRLRAQQLQLRLGQALRHHQLAGAMELLAQHIVLTSGDRSGDRRRGH